MKKDTQLKAVQITINNPEEHGYTEEKITQILKQSRIRYACMSREIGDNGTEHIHLYVLFPSARRFSTLKKRFPKAHIEKAYGDPYDNRDYIRKEGKWKETAKAETSVEGSFREFGEIPDSYILGMPEMDEIYEDIKNGVSTSDILENHPKHLFKVNSIDAVRQAYLSDKYREHLRAVVVTYIYGATATGKTRSIFKRHAPEQICRITTYGKNGVKFDSYRGENVLVFEEFASQIPIEEMLNYLDIYPIMLPARYNDKVACFTKVYITSNLPINRQYVAVQEHKPKTFQAFLRRINYLEHFKADGTVEKTTLNKEVKLNE